MTRIALIGLLGAGGEPVDLRRTLGSHGVAGLPPVYLDEGGLGATLTLATPEGPRTVRLSEAATAGTPAVAVDVVDAGPPPGEAASAALAAAIRRMLCLDDDLSDFYARAAADPELAWAARGAGRLLRSPTVFEDVVKTVCTTNCAWSATVRMTGALVGRLGEPAPGAPPGDVAGRAFPTPEAMAAAGDAFYRDVARAGYRGPYLRAIAGAGRRRRAGPRGSCSAPAAPSCRTTRSSAGCWPSPASGPYAAAHVMLLLGRHSRLVLDSWTRPRYARLVGKPKGRLVADRTIARRFRRYGEYAGLAFWLVLTRDWVDDEEA